MTQRAWGTTPRFADRFGRPKPVKRRAGRGLRSPRRQQISSPEQRCGKVTRVATPLVDPRRGTFLEQNGGDRWRTSDLLRGEAGFGTRFGDRRRLAANAQARSTSWGSLVRAQYRPSLKPLLMRGFRFRSGKRFGPSVPTWSPAESLPERQDRSSEKQPLQVIPTPSRGYVVAASR
jgi:hypothetical protein